MSKCIEGLELVGHSAPHRPGTELALWSVGRLCLVQPDAMNRWSSFCVAAEWHGRVWHSRLLAITALGIKTKVYTGMWDCPALGGAWEKGSNRGGA